MSEPMTDERYQTIQAHAEIVHGWRDTPDSYADVQIPLMAMILGADVLTLLAEVDRLRADIQAVMTAHEAVAREVGRLADENAAMRPVVGAVAEHIGGYVSEHFRQCAFCGNGAVESRIIVHANDCEVEQARAFVAAHPATDTTSEARERGRGR